MCMIQVTVEQIYSRHSLSLISQASSNFKRAQLHPENQNGLKKMHEQDVCFKPHAYPPLEEQWRFDSHGPRHFQDVENRLHVIGADCRVGVICDKSQARSTSLPDQMYSSLKNAGFLFGGCGSLLR